MPGQRRSWKVRVGELAVYPGHGVARIVEFRIQEIAGQSMEFVVLRMVDDDSRILIPREKIDKVGLRSIVGTKDADRIWKILRSRAGHPRARGIAWSRQFREYQDKVRTGTVFQIAEVLRDLLRLQCEKELSFGEHKLLESARTLIVQELAAAQRSEATEVEREIKSIVV